MTITAAHLATALLWALVGGLGAWLLLTPIRRRWLTGLFASVVLAGTGASIGALLGGVDAMLLPMQDWMTLVVLTVAAGAIATAAATVGARRLTRDNRALQLAIADLAAGRVPDTGGRPLSAEYEQMRLELSRTASALAETRERERSLEAARRDLVSWVSHDLRTPLAGLRAIAEALEDGVAEDPSSYYKQIGASVERLSGMVDDLFDLSRIQAGAAPRAAERLDVDDLVSDCIAALRPLADSRRVALLGRSAGHAPVLGNGPELNRALTNLLANAIRHTNDDGTVRVSVVCGPAAVEVDVQDECGGIPVDDLARVFDVGFRGEQARPSHDDAGAGLGLAIAEGIVTAHEGALTVRNVAGGCCFSLCLPLAGPTVGATAR